MILAKLRDFQYYLKSTSIFLKGSYGMDSHLYTMFELLPVLDDSIEQLFDLLNVDTEIAGPINPDNYDEYNELASDILDKLGMIFGINRQFDITYQFTEEGISNTYTENILLNNIEFMTLIKAKIIQNNYDGCRETLEEYYAKYNLPIIMQTVQEGTRSAECNVFWNYDANIPANHNELTNLHKIFLAGMLTLQSMGITYIYNITNDTKMAFWDDDNVNRLWDEGVWQ